MLSVKGVNDDLGNFKVDLVSQSTLGQPGFKLLQGTTAKTGHRQQRAAALAQEVKHWADLGQAGPAQGGDCPGAESQVGHRALAKL